MASVVLFILIVLPFLYVLLFIDHPLNLFPSKACYSIYYYLYRLFYTCFCCIIINFFVVELFFFSSVFIIYCLYLFINSVICLIFIYFYSFSKTICFSFCQCVYSPTVSYVSTYSIWCIKFNIYSLGLFFHLHLLKFYLYIFHLMLYFQKLHFYSLLLAVFRILHNMLYFGYFVV